jgi:hypothetical protein
MPQQPTDEAPSAGDFALLDDVRVIDTAFFRRDEEDAPAPHLRGPWHPVFGDMPEYEPAV